MKKLRILLFLLTIFSMSGAYASKLVQCKVLDKDYIMLWFYDGEVVFKDDGKGDGAFTNYGGTSESNNSVVYYGDALDTDKATSVASYTLISEDDARYANAGLSPDNCYRKTKINGMAELGWLNSVSYNNFGDYEYKYTYQHWIYLKLPESLQRGKTYTLNLSQATNADTASVVFTFDEFQMSTEAIHVNLVGYSDDNRVKAADVYHWMGDGGTRDYSAFEGNAVYLYNVETKDTINAGTLSYYMESEKESGFYDYIKSKVWHADFTGITTPGNYRVVVEGIGCSKDFAIHNNVYYNPFAVSVQGYYYMRAGEDSTHGLPLVPRRPLWIPGENPSNCKVLITTMTPYHSAWGSFSSGDRWDNPDDWADYVKSGSPQNPNAIGGHVDALDWDRHLGHVANIYDMLLPYILTGGYLDDDDTNIAESGNGIPDIIDEARNEVDLWLSLRDGKGYSHGLTNPTKNSNIIYQAGTSSLAAFANAFNAAMLAESFRIAGMTDLMGVYADSAIAAYNYGLSIFNASNNYTQSIGEDVMDEEDFIMNAAAFLYNLTGDTKYEDKIKALSRVNSATSLINKRDKWNQLWGTAAYLITPQEVNYPELFKNMKASAIYQARELEAKWVNKRATRRSNSNNRGYYPTAIFNQCTILAHAVASNEEKRHFFEDALILEADWSLGRNPANMVQMTTATTALENLRSVQNCYTNGRNDGVPGLNPGHTPYWNTNNWAPSMIMGSPGKLVEKNYPKGGDNWPKAELFYNTRYVWAHAEFTPRQTMRGKMALYGYLHGLAKMRASGDSIDVGSIKIYPDTVYFYPENTRTLNLVVTPANAFVYENYWSSEFDTVASVTQSGEITGVNVGQTLIHSRVNESEADSCLVMVMPIEVPVAGINLNKDTLQMRTGWKKDLIASISPENASDTSVIWFSADSAVAVPNNGKVNAVGIGETYVYAKTVNEKKVDSCLIQVVEVPDLLCHLGFEEIDLLTIQDLSGNENIGKAFGQPSLVAGRIGNALAFTGDEHAEITHNADFNWDKNHDYSMSVWVFVDKLKSNWTGIVTKSRDLTPWSGLWISPENKWHSANAIQNSSKQVVEKKWYHVALVQNTTLSKHQLYVDGALMDEGNLVQDTENGDIWIGGAKTTEEFFIGKVDELKLFSVALSASQVNDLYQKGLVGGNTAVTGVSIVKDTLELEVGETAILEANVKPVNAIDQRISWSSDNEAVATVNQHGKVMAVSKGVANIEVKTNESGYADQCKITIINKTTIEENDKKQNLANVYPNPANNVLTVQLNTKLSSAKLQIINACGKTLKTIDSIQSVTSVDISHLLAGVYFVEVLSAQHAQTLRFIKL